MNIKNVVLAIHEGRMKESKVDDKVRRMLRAMFAMNLIEQEIPEGAELHTPEHIAIAKKVAESGIVLLKNNGDLLPLSTDKFKSVAVIGPNASILRTGGGGSSKIDPIEAKSPLDALKEKVKDMKISYHGSNIYHCIVYDINGTCSNFCRVKKFCCSFLYIGNGGKHRNFRALCGHRNSSKNF